MPDRYAVTPRAELGKRTKLLRRDGTLPCNVYGRGLDSMAVQLPQNEAEMMLAEHGMNSLIELLVDGEGKERPVVVRAIQRHPLSRELQHMDFYQVDITRTLQANVPVTVTGESPAVHTYQGITITGLDRVLVEALPAAMPAYLEISVDSLAELDDQLTVADLEVAEGVRVLSDPEIMIVRIARPRVIEEEVTTTLLEGEAGVLEEGEDGAAEGEVPREGGATDERQPG